MNEKNTYTLRHKNSLDTDNASELDKTGRIKTEHMSRNERARRGERGVEREEEREQHFQLDGS